VSHSTLEEEVGREPWRRRVVEVAERVVRETLARPATLGHGRLVCVDGPAGSGKSTLGQAIRQAASAVGTSELVHLDDLLDGWSGLDRVSDTLRRDVLTPLDEGMPGKYRRYDWHGERFAEEHVVEPVDLLVVEGVSSGASSYSSWITTLVWVEAPADLCLSRGVARDGEELRPQWVRWMAHEAALFMRERTRDRAHVHVDGTGGADQVLRA
jgi:hypothetical protein